MDEPTRETMQAENLAAMTDEQLDAEYAAFDRKLEDYAALIAAEYKRRHRKPPG